jgi:hypothetical protein
MTFVQKPSDPARDFCQWPYQRPNAPNIGAWRQEKILFDFLEDHQCRSALADMLKQIQLVNGRFNTVWGLKSDGRRYSLELYFYDYARRMRRLGPEEILTKANVKTVSGIFPDENIDYFMWSIELDLFADISAAEIDIYCNGSGGTVSGGICYSSSQNRLELKNLYYFYKSKPDQQNILEQLASQPFGGGLRRYPETLLPGALCEEIYVLALKRRHASLYFSRAPLEACLRSMEDWALLPDLRRYLHLHMQRYSHHLFDIGIDYRVDNTEVQLTRMAVFGIF